MGLLGLRCAPVQSCEQHLEMDECATSVYLPRLWHMWDKLQGPTLRRKVWEVGRASPCWPFFSELDMVCWALSGEEIRSPMVEYYRERRKEGGDPRDLEEVFGEEGAKRIDQELCEVLGAVSIAPWTLI